MKVSAFLFISLLMIHMAGYAAEADLVQVDLKQVEDRVHATVTGPEIDVPQPKQGLLDRNLEKAEKETVKAAKTSGKLVGEGTDKAVETVQKVSKPFFSRVIHALDFHKKSE